MITFPDHIRQFVERGLANARRELQQKGDMNPVFAFEIGGKMDVCPGNFGPFLDSGDGKDFLFTILRKAAHVSHATAAVVITDSWFATEAPLFTALPDSEKKRIMDTATFQDLIDKGWFTKREALQVTAQTHDTVLLIQQFYERDDGDGRRRVTFTERQETIQPQEQFDGRGKMFGAEPSAISFHDPAGRG